MQTLEVTSSHGSLTVNKETGEIITVLSTGDADDYLPGIARFDITEFKNYYKKDPPDSVDILDLGFWTKTGEYDDPAFDWREEFRGQRTA